MNARIIDAGIVLQEICPHGEWDIKNNDYDTLIWSENNPVVKPTKEEYQNKKNELKEAEPLRLLRIQRNQLLAETDWMALNDVVMSDAWKTYRQQLRDLPSTANPQLNENRQLINVVWPTKPEN